ncbi:TetR/AcrR family transcriptional regulator [Clavibacter michiganensis]|uniref:TetR/AcrR family transcriptional regulator n=1 Tax=Clavibacter michiganensis TaxID=28447 RepID=UPI0026DD60E3|nr:TetR/AcrR family transcriptional regulator [Clavibacter michiganensis]MDO4027561.1 TetR/AcrR family transcriptional regulator [Clavibacter michiganensis]
MGEDKPLRADARRNREAIIAAARAVFEHDEQLRFDDFAARAGVGVGTLYRHFPTREALAAAVYRGEVAALCERGRASTLPPAEALERFLRAFVDYVLEHAPLARTLAGIVDDAARDEGGSELERTLTDLMSRGVADGTLRDDVSARAVMMALHGIGAAADGPRRAPDAREVASLLARGLRVA